MKKHELPSIKEIVEMNRIERVAKRKESKAKSAEFQKKLRPMIDNRSLEQMIEDKKDSDIEQFDEALEVIESVRAEIKILKIKPSSKILQERNNFFKERNAAVIVKAKEFLAKKRNKRKND